MDGRRRLPAGRNFGEARYRTADRAADGTIQFADVETGDTHTASFTSQPGYVGTFSLDPVSESGGTGSVDWHFTVNNSDIQFLSQGETLTQTYQVNVADNHGGATEQDVTITILGANDAPRPRRRTLSRMPARTACWSFRIGRWSGMRAIPTRPTR
jgi:VCBS repeat-containing protein